MQRRKNNKKKEWSAIKKWTLKIKGWMLFTYPPAAAAWRQVLPKSSGVSMSKPINQVFVKQLCNAGFHKTVLIYP